MAIGINICGLNGCGKSTIGRILADKIGFHFIDNETLFFDPADDNDPYSKPRTRSEAENLLLKEVNEHGDFVLSAVKGDYGKEITDIYKLVVVLEVPKNVRTQRIRNRSFGKFGNRMLPGGDLYESEESFFKMAESRNEEYVESWICTLNCPVIRIDGTKSIDEIVSLISERLKSVFKDLRNYEYE